MCSVDLSTLLDVSTVLPTKVGNKRQNLQIKKKIYSPLHGILDVYFFPAALSVSATGRLSDICRAGVGSPTARAPGVVQAGPDTLQPGHRLRSDPLPGKTAVKSTHGCHGTSWRGQTFDSPADWAEWHPEDCIYELITMAFSICLLWLRGCSKMLVNEGFCVSSAQFHSSAAVFRGFIILLFCLLAWLACEPDVLRNALTVNYFVSTQEAAWKKKQKPRLPRLSYCNVIKQCNTFSNAFKVSVLTQRVNKLLPGSNMSVFPSLPTKRTPSCFLHPRRNLKSKRWRCDALFAVSDEQHRTKLFLRYVQDGICGKPTCRKQKAATGKSGAQPPLRTTRVCYRSCGGSLVC